MKTNGVYKRAYNQCLDLLAGRAPDEVLASEPTLAAQLGVSRTTVRAVITGLVERGIVGQEGRERRLLRLPSRADYLDSADLEPVADMLERKFMAWMVGPDCHPGGVINGLDLARQFGVSTSAIRECLNKFSHFGLLERQSNGRWRVSKRNTTRFSPISIAVIVTFRNSITASTSSSTASRPTAFSATFRA